MDIFATAAVVRELAPLLPGARVNKIHQPAPELLILRLWTGREELRLLLSTGPGEPRLHLTETSYPNPFTAPRFCQLLRSRLSRIIALEQVPGERIIRIAFAGSGGERYTLVAELFGRPANLLLLDSEGGIVDLLHRVEAGEGRRTLLPGVPYEPPAPPPRIDLAAVLPEVPPEIDSPVSFSRWLLERVAPMTPLAAADLAAGFEKGIPPEKLLGALREEILSGETPPRVGVWKGRPVAAFLPLRHMALEHSVDFPTPSAALEALAQASSGPAAGTGEREALLAPVRRQLAKLARRSEKLAGEDRDRGEIDRGRRLGELLLANLHRVKKGMTEVVLDDYYQDPPLPVAVPLDPRLTPQENAQALFSRFKKKKRGLDHIARRQEETGRERAWLEEVALSIEEAENGEDLQAVRQELVAAGLLREERKDPRRRPGIDPRAQLRSAQSPGGLTLWWGKGARSNDLLSRELTGPDDLWFHAHGMPGCHLVLKRAGKGEIPEADILFAASVAAGHSRGKDDTRVEVMVAEGRAVRKPKGAPPGQVVVERFRTVAVRPFRPAEED